MFAYLLSFLLFSLVPIVSLIEWSQNPMLRSSAVLALCKFMCVSAEFCEKHLQLLFTLAERSTEAAIRANVVIAMGDLALRFPNLIEPWTPHLYARLRDKDVRVTKNTLLVLTHLILNDMIKVKGKLSRHHVRDCVYLLCMSLTEEEVINITRVRVHVHVCLCLCALVRVCLC